MGSQIPLFILVAGGAGTGFFSGCGGEEPEPRVDDDSADDDSFVDDDSFADDDYSVDDDSSVDDDTPIDDDSSDDDSSIDCDPATYSSDDYIECGVGACFNRVAATSCLDGNIIENSCTPFDPQPETCLNMSSDDNCDGVEDNIPLLGEPCDNGSLGACFASGVLACDAEFKLACDAPKIEPVEESCLNAGEDNDCNGVRDDIAALGGACDNGLLGYCFAEGSRICLGGGLACTAPAVLPLSAEDRTCDLIDDNCDGAVDEDGVPDDLKAGDIKIGAEDLWIKLLNGYEGAEIEISAGFYAGGFGGELSPDEILFCDETESTARTLDLAPCGDVAVMIGCADRLVFSRELYAGTYEWNVMYGDEVVTQLIAGDDYAAGITTDIGDGFCYYFHTTSACE